jgi:acetylornithine aminotransferase
VSVSHPSPTHSSAEILSIYVERSWRSNAQRQLNKGIDFVIGKREGIYLWNLEGTKRVIDCSTAGGVHSLGHRHPEVVAALTGAIDGGRDTGLWSLPNAEYLWLQDKLAELAPSRALDRSVITLSSTTSVDVATMFAFRFTGRQKLVAYRHGYHGHSGFAALATGSAEEGVIDYYRLPRQYAKFFDTYNALDELAHVLTPDVAALIVEPINYETFEPASKAYFEGAQALCRDRNILFIVDETRTGLGRTGRLWASEHYDIAPDIMIVGKGLSGGLYPASALLMRFDIYERCMNQHDFAYISSLGGNEISCIVAKKVLEVASQPEFLDHVNRISAVLSRELASVCSRRHNLLSPGVAHGGLFSVRIHDSALASLLYQAIYRHGVLCHSVSVIEPCVLKFLPPLTLDEVGAHEIAEALDRAVQGIGT